MTDDSWIRIIVFGSIFVVAAFLGKYKKPRHNKTIVRDGVMRLPKSTGNAGWMFVVLGIMSIVASAVLSNQAKYPLLVLGLFLMPLGVVLISYYRNWYLVLLSEEIVMRTLTKKIVRIRYDAVISAEVRRIGRRVMLRIRDTNGTKLSADDRYVDSATIIQTIQYVQDLQRLARLPPSQGPSPYTRADFHS